MNRRDDPVGILLAAGRSRRFGGDKLLHPLEDGLPLGLASANALRAVAPRTVAVVRADNEPLIALFTAHRIEIAVARDADAGMGASLAAGIAATAAARGWIVALGDMPFIRPQTIASVAERLRRGASLVAPAYQGRRGHPVGFSAAHRDALLKLSGDEGARAVLQQHAEELVLLDCGDPGVLADIDTR